MVLILAVGCAPSEIKQKDFSDTLADVLCSRVKECDLGAYQSAYFGRSDCEAWIARDLDVIVEIADDLDCDYSPREAANAWSSLAEMSCEDFYEDDYVDDLGEIWDDCGISFLF